MPNVRPWTEPVSVQKVQFQEGSRDEDALHLRESTDLKDVERFTRIFHQLSESSMDDEKKHNDHENEGDGGPRKKPSLSARLRKKLSRDRTSSNGRSSGVLRAKTRHSGLNNAHDSISSYVDGSAIEDLLIGINEAQGSYDKDAEVLSLPETVASSRLALHLGRQTSASERNHHKDASSGESATIHQKPCRAFS